MRQGLPGYKLRLNGGLKDGACQHRGPGLRTEGVPRRGEANRVAKRKERTTLERKGWRGEHGIQLS